MSLTSIPAPQPNPLAVIRPCLLRGSLWALAASSAAAAGPWALIAILARFGSPGQVGRYALAVAIVSPVCLAANLQLRTLFVADAAGASSFPAYWRLGMLSSGAAVAVVAVAAAALDRELGTVAVPVAAIKLMENAADLCHGVWQRREQLSRVAAAWWLKAAGSVVSFASVLAVYGNLSLALAAAASVHCAILLLVERPAGPRAGPSGPVLPLLRRALPLGLILVSINLVPAVPRYFIEWRQGRDALGYFAALGCFPLALQAVAGAVARAALARLAERFRRDRPQFLRLTRRMAGCTAAVGLLGVAASPALAHAAGWIYGPSYAAHGDLLAWLMTAGAAFAVSGALGIALTAAAVTLVQLLLYCLSLVVCVAACWFWVVPERSAGPAQALALSALVLAAGKAALLAKLERDRP